MTEPPLDRQRALFALSFEPAENGYVYYHRRWSRGIPVTAEERDAYLRIPAWGSRHAWQRAIAGRPTVPPRPYRPVQRKLLATMPGSMIVSGLAVGLPLIASGFATLPSLAGIACMIGGLALTGFAGQIAFAKLRAGKAGPAP